MDDDHEPYSKDDTVEEKDWAGVSMDVIYQGKGPWHLESTPISPSKYHAVMYQLPAVLYNVPKPHHKSNPFTWKTDFVRMPFSSKNLMVVCAEDGEEFYKPRWDIIETSLLQPILNCRQLEDAIISYRGQRVPFTSLHHFFDEILEEEETQNFFDNVLPNIIQLALQLPVLLPGGLPLLKENSTRSISLSQQQIGSLLANAFLCTFPWHKDSSNYPGINFNKLYEVDLNAARLSCVIEKLKCICHYFRRICTKIPFGVVTFKRKSMYKSQLPRWDRSRREISQSKLHVSSSGTIEDDGLGLLQVDFANCIVGGGVLHSGCVQEEIRFIICPELIISRLFTEKLGSLEALVIKGAERYSNYSGYGESFIWTGDHQDQTPYDSCSRRKTTIVAIDALHFCNPNKQYEPGRMLRELNKAYVGFHSRNASEENKVSAVATGNWGCGAFRGDPYLKSLLQIMACTAAFRDIAYFTFGDKKLRDKLQEMHSFLSVQHITIVQLWRYLCQFGAAQLSPTHLFSFIQQAHLDHTTNIDKPPPPSQLGVKKFLIPKATTSGTFTQSVTDATEIDSAPPVSQNSTPEFSLSSCGSDVVLCSQESTVYFEPAAVKPSKLLSPNRQKEKMKLSPDNHERIVALFDIIDGKTSPDPSICKESGEEKLTSSLSGSLLSSVDDFSAQHRDNLKLDAEDSHSKKEIAVSSNVTNISETSNISNSTSKLKTASKTKKISDYFIKMDKK